MGNEIPTYFAQKQQDVATMPRATNIQGITDVGGGLKAEAMMATGKNLAAASSSLFKLNKERQEEKDNTSLATAMSELNEYTYTESKTLETKVWPKPGEQGYDPEQFAKSEAAFAKGRQKKIKDISSKHNRDVSERFGQYAINTDVRDRSNHHANTFGAEQKFREAEFNRQYGEKFKQFSHDPAELKNELQLLVKQYEKWFNPVYIEKVESEIDTKIAEYKYEERVTQVHDAAKDMPYAQAMNFIDEVDGIEKEDRSNLVKRRERQQEWETASENPTVYWDTLRKVMKNPNSMTEQQIGDLVKPDSLSTDNYKEIMKFKDPDGKGPLTRPDVKVGLGYIDRLRGMGFFVHGTESYAELSREDKVKNEQAFADVKNAYIYWVENNPDATSAQVEMKWKALTEPIREKIVLGWFEKTMLPKESKSGFQRKFIGSEKQTLANKQVKALKEELPEWWDMLSGADKKDIRKEFESGATVQDVVDRKNELEIEAKYGR